MENSVLTTTTRPKFKRDPVKTVILASMMGTAIEFFDFYAYGTASATYFPRVFFPPDDSRPGDNPKPVDLWGGLRCPARRLLSLRPFR